MDQNLKDSLEDWKIELEKKKKELEELNVKAQNKKSFLEAKTQIAQFAVKNVSVTKQKEFAEKFITPVFEELDKHEVGMHELRQKNNAEIRELEALIFAITTYIEKQ